jgi:hypothetical protein
MQWRRGHFKPQRSSAEPEAIFAPQPHHDLLHSAGSMLAEA